jgi:hypothetical protein
MFLGPVNQCEVQMSFTHTIDADAVAQVRISKYVLTVRNSQ